MIEFDNYSITVSNLSKNFGTTKAIDSLNLNFVSHSMHGIIGPDGAGKTTLFRIICGLLNANNGKIIFKKNELELKIDFEKIKDDIAYMPQQQCLYQDLSILEHLKFFKELYKLDNDFFNYKKEELLKITRLDKFQDRPAGKLSGGMYKKLGLMCSLLREPKILLLDEPTNGVDPISRKEFWDLLTRLSESDILIIISTSYINEAENCNFAHLMQNGKILKSGKPKELIKNNNVKNIEELFLIETNEETKN